MPPRSLRSICLAAAAIVVTAVLVSGRHRADEPVPGAFRDDATTIALGRDLYAERCAACHGAHLEGQAGWQTVARDGKVLAPPQDETGHTWHHTHGELFRLVKFSVADVAPDGYVSDMPAFGDTLSDDQIRAVLAYIKSRWPRDIRAYQALITNPTAAQAAALGEDWRFPPLCEEPSRTLAAARQKAARQATPEPATH
jgi:mono/diheme cytochrome c family protein